MLRNWKLATILAIAISAGGTWGSVQAGGHGHSGGSSHSGGSYSSRGGTYAGGSRPSGTFKPSGGGSNNGNSGNSGVIRSGNLGGINLGKPGGNSGGVKSLPKNTGVVGPLVPRVGPSNTGVAGGIKLPGVGNVGGSNSGKPGSGNSNSGVVKKGNINGNPILKSPALGNLGINLGNKFPNNGPGQGNGNGPGNGNGNGPGNGNGNGNHHHHHCWPPIVISLPYCQPNYCPPPCPPIYYPQPYPVAVPIVDPAPIVVTEPAPAVVVNNNVIVDGKPVDPAATDKPAEQQTSTEAAAADAKPADPKATDLVSKDVALPKIPVGATLTLQGKDLADKQGQVVLQLGEIALPATINEWKNDSVTCTLPVLGLTKASKATLHVVKADGKTASTMNCELVTTLPTSVEAVPASATDIDSAKYEQ
jgi:hypothetical protein